MEVSDSKIKNSYTSGNGTLHFPAKAQNIKKYTPRKFLMLQETETPKNSFIFSKKLFLYFGKRET